VTHAQLAILVLLAVLLALAALVVAVLAFVRARTATTAIATLTSPRREPPTPRNLARERRVHDEGPPAGVDDRRGAHRAPDDLGRARRRDVDDPRYAGTTERPLPPMPEDEPATDEHAPPTRDMRALPRPGSIPRS
jgi:hypothetical protein